MVTDLFSHLHPVWQALLATCFTWALTAAGAAVVFGARRSNQKALDFMLGFAAGVMTAASYWSLLAPALEMAAEFPGPAWLPAAAGFVLGGLFLRLVDLALPHIHPQSFQREGPKSSWRRTILLVMAITIHNIPEGLAVGVAFGALGAGLPAASSAGAMALALGIGIQNFPEGMAVAMPLRREGLSRAKSFFYGQLSGMVEPAAGVLGAWLVILARPLLPYALAFAAGAMIFVVVEDVIPESQAHGHTDLATSGVLTGFTVMMILDVALG